MSYQFEDDSALEELLNQQLDQRKRQQPARASISARQQQPPPLTTIKSVTTSRPSTGNIYQSSNVSKNRSLLNTKADDDPQPARGKLASWLQSDSSAVRFDNHVTNSEKPSSSLPLQTEYSQSSEERSTNQVVGLDLELDFNEERLQEMTKQRLIQFILMQIVPTLKQFKQLNREQTSGAEFKKLVQELDLERAKINSLDKQHREQLESVEEKWQRLNNQLERNVKLSESQLKETIETLRSRLEREQLEHEQAMKLVAENYHLKMGEAKKEAEAKLVRRDELHKLELESKLRVDCNLLKMETIFGEWGNMLEKTIQDLGNQFKLVECLLDKQTLEIKGTNESVEGKSRAFDDKLEKFLDQSKQLSVLVEEFRVTLPKFSNFQQENERIAKQTTLQLEELFRKSTHLEEKEQQCVLIKDNLEKTKGDLEKEKFQVLLDSNKVSLKEERLKELIATNETKEMKLDQLKIAQSEREGQLEQLKGSLMQRTALIKEQNYELHLVRRRLLGKEEELSKLESAIGTRENILKAQQVDTRAEFSKLASLRMKVQKELNQLRRVQKSLICSICLDRLFNREQLVEDNINYKWTGQKLSSTQLEQRKTRFSKMNQLASTFKDELDVDKILHQIETEAKQLETETKYAKTLSAEAN